MLERETQKEGEGETETERGSRGFKKKTGRGSMKPPNNTLRGKHMKLDHSMTASRGNKQLVGKQNGSSLCLRLQSCIVGTD